ncbi:HU domain-containing protein [Ulvibacterium marinum]|uniref:SPOR domain-containing protein n=1 Tax=Ulvibacterium marinum TaxID=2419782 RepID=A0A3B0CCG5_9FLAO|nr:SPOR domain-containing protein [Ulvibacterium marinum]RKN82720.1 SPOR domain-containing protein [Ulvibacterium marinum]
MALEHYITELLYRYDCVVIPGFGAFLTQTKSSILDTTTHTFHPPTKMLSFNKQLTSNDGLLVSYISKVEKISYEATSQKIDRISKEWSTRLQKNEKLELPNLGELWLNEIGKIQFQPYEQVNYLTSSFGFSSFPSSPVLRENLKERVVVLEEKVPFAFTPEKRKEYSFRPYLKYAAVFFLALATGLTGFRSYQEAQNREQLARQEAQEQISKRIQEATFFSNRPMELPTFTLDVVTKKGLVKGTHHVIAGAFRFRANADKKIQQLNQLGFKASYLGANAFGLHMVAYSSHNDPKKALEALKQVRRTHSSDAWLKSVK